MRKSVSLVIGWRYGYLQVLKQINESALMEMRSYLVRAECCGTVTERSERAIRDTERKGRACCQECWWREKRVVQAPMQRVGPILVLHKGSAPETWVVRWDCCGREVEISEARVRNIRNLTRKGKTTLCGPCHGATWVGVPNALRMRQPDDIEEEDDDLLPVLHTGTGNLPPGLISAALAWPRPRLLVAGGAKCGT